MDPRTDELEYAEMLSALISSLGGPTCAAGDLAWASSMPQGRSLLQWLSSQISHGDVISKGSQSGNDIKCQAALQSIALHDQELLEFNANSSAAKSQGSGPPAGYQSPLSLGANSRLSKEEAELVQKETQLLKHRLNRSKAAAKELAQTIKTLRTEVEAAGNEVRLQDAKLSELSINTDNAITRSVRTAELLLHASGTDESRNTSAQGTLTSLLQLHGRIASAASQQFAAIDEATASLPTPAEVQQEAARLHESLHSSRDKRTRVRAPSDSTESSSDVYIAHLDELAALLEAAPEEKMKRDIIDKLLREERSSESRDEVGVDIKDEVARAWSLDQYAILHAREKVTDETTALLTKDLLPQLSALHTVLAARTAHTLEQEALASALIEELEDIADDVAAVNASARPGADGDAPKKRGHEMLENELTELLKRTQGLRPRDAGPLVLLEREDVVKELAAVRERAGAAERAEEAWVSNLMPKLIQLSDGHAELLSLAYENAPVNTSPPFGPSSEARALQESVKEATGRLNARVQLLEKETQFNDRDRRKLTAFVEKWAR